MWTHRTTGFLFGFLKYLFYLCLIILFMKFQSEIEIDDEHLKVLLDYLNGYDLDDEYFNLMNKQDIEKEMCWELGLLDSGFYQHYPLSPTPLGSFILKQYNKTLK